MTRTLGCDVSHWSGKVDFAKMGAAGASFMYAKASQLSADDTFKANWQNAKGIMPRGAFHYLDFSVSELVQAKLFTDTMGGDWGELPPTLDLEMDPGKLTKDVVQGKVWNWLQSVEKTTGRVPMIYSGASYWTYWMTPDKGWLKYPFWLAWYSSETYINIISLLKGYSHGAPKPWKNWTLWQYSGNGNGLKYGSQGLSMDMNWCDDLDALKAFANGPIPTPYLPPKPPIPAPKPLYPTYQTIYAVNVRSGPSQAARNLGVMPMDTQVSIDTIDASGYSHFVPTKEFTNGGFIFSAYLKKV
jgi:lysozyme